MPSYYKKNRRRVKSLGQTHPRFEGFKPMKTKTVASGGGSLERRGFKPMKTTTVASSKWPKPPNRVETLGPGFGLSGGTKRMHVGPSRKAFTNSTVNRKRTAGAAVGAAALGIGAGVAIKRHRNKKHQTQIDSANPKKGRRR